MSDGRERFVELELDEDKELPPARTGAPPGPPLLVVPGEVLAEAAAAPTVRDLVAALPGYRVDAERPVAGGWRAIAFAAPDGVPAGRALEQVVEAVNPPAGQPRARLNRIVGCPRLMGGKFPPDPPDPLSAPDFLPLGEGAGLGVRVAVLDTPPLYHPQLVGHVAHLPASEQSTSEAPAGPARGHCLLVAGIVLRYAPGAAVEIVGVLDDDGYGRGSHLADALAALDPEVQLVNLSLGTRARRLPAVQEALEALYRRGVGVVASAGNDGEHYEIRPAAERGVVGVTSIVGHGDAMRLASWSQRGPWIRAAARGVERYGPFVFGRRTQPVAGGTHEATFAGWGAWSGTSFAAPVVVGAAAARLAAEPGLSGREALDAVLADAPERTLEEPPHGRPTRVRIVDPEPVWPHAHPG